MTNFLNSLASLGTLTSNPKRPRQIDPLARMKSAFKVRVQTQIELLQVGNHCDDRSWFKRVEAADGGAYFIASLRNGTKALPLAESTRHIELKTEEHLLQFFKGAMNACDSGELDQLLMQTAPKPKENV